MSSNDETGSKRFIPPAGIQRRPLLQIIFPTTTTPNRINPPTMSRHFTITTHIVRAQHTRGRPAGAERGRENELRLHVKQYVPKTNPNPQPDDVTIIGAQANGFPKECYEPFWDDLYGKLQARGRAIRGIWMADIASQGQSGNLNDGKCPRSFFVFVTLGTARVEVDESMDSYHS
jgi:hypothetical protein